MAKAAKVEKKKVKRGLVAGLFREGSSIANVYEALEDGKAHSISSLKGCAAEKGLDIALRVRSLGQVGRQHKKFDVEFDGTRAQLVKYSAKAVHTRAKASKDEDEDERPAKKAAKKPAPAASRKGGPKVQDVPVDDD
jgi:hypothetical protein